MPVVKEDDSEWATVVGTGGFEDEDLALLEQNEGHLYMMVHLGPQSTYERSQRGRSLFPAPLC